MSEGSGTLPANTMKEMRGREIRSSGTSTSTLCFPSRPSSSRRRRAQEKQYNSQVEDIAPGQVKGHAQGHGCLENDSDGTQDT